MKKTYKVYKVVDSKDKFVLDAVLLAKYYYIALDEASLLSRQHPNTLYCVFEFDSSTHEIKLLKSFLC